jgi:L-2-hydroxyglutarate oxidase LhgO
MNEGVDCVVIGAGVVGLAIGRSLALAGREVLIVERNAGIGEETSARNSEVVHAGIYYPSGSLKASLCVRGKSLLYAYCEARQIPFSRCGKLIVATCKEQLARLDAIAAGASRNGVDDLLLLDAAAIAEREPAVRALAGLWSPSSGIVDSHALMLALAGDIEAAGGLIATHTRVDSIAVDADRIRLDLTSGTESSALSARTVVNAAGLDAGRLAAATAGTGAYRPPAIRFARGNYFSYDGPSPFRALVYPLPAAGGLGIHATHDLAGRLRFGPDFEWVESIDYRVDAGRRPAFAEAIREYWPELDERRLTAGYAGIRPRLAAAGESWADFCLDLPAAKARRQILHLLGIESPGLTAALALAEAAVARL